MNKKTQFDNIEKYYNHLVTKHGDSPRSCDYGRPESQRTKFEVLSGVLSRNDRTLLDVGCGLGDYYQFLLKKNYKLDYFGMDLSGSMVALAREKYEGIHVVQKNIIELDESIKYDVISANGIFYLLQDNPEKTMKALISKMYLLATRSIAFNSLSSFCQDQEKEEFYANPVEVMRFCMSLTPWVRLCHDYHHRDFTVYMFKDLRI